jgi:hypothetical protein
MPESASLYRFVWQSGVHRATATPGAWCTGRATARARTTRPCKVQSEGIDWCEHTFARSARFQALVRAGAGTAAAYTRRTHPLRLLQNSMPPGLHLGHGRVAGAASKEREVQGAGVLSFADHLCEGLLVRVDLGWLALAEPHRRLAATIAATTAATCVTICFSLRSFLTALAACLRTRVLAVVHHSAAGGSRSG